MKTTLNSTKINPVSVLDSRQLNMLVGAAGENAAELLHDLIEVFIEENMPHVEGLRPAIDAADFTLAVKRAHFIAGSSANMGGLRLSHLCTELEREAPRADAAHLLKMTAKIEEEFQLTINSLRREIEKLTR